MMNKLKDFYFQYNNYIIQQPTYSQFPTSITKKSQLFKEPMSQQQTFQQKRIVELSKKVDQQRHRTQSLIKETHDLTKQLHFVQESYEKEALQRQELQRLERDLRRQVLNLTQENSTIKQQRGVLQKKLIESQYSLMRVKQSIQQVRQQHMKQKQQLKQQVFERQKSIQQKQRQIMKQRQQNLQLQKLYLNKRQELHRGQEKHFKQLNKLMMEFKLLKSEIQQQGKLYEDAIVREKSNIQGMCRQFDEKVKEVERKIQEARVLRKEIAQLEERLQEVVVENSQRIIELYNVKYNYDK